MRRVRRLATIFVLAIILSGASSSDVLACYWCDYSPHGWGFCKSGAQHGDTSCSTVVVDAFNGRTDCYPLRFDCRQGGTPVDNGLCPDCQPYYQTESSPCSWIGADVKRLV